MSIESIPRPSLHNESFALMSAALIFKFSGTPVAQDFYTASKGRMPPLKQKTRSGIANLISNIRPASVRKYTLMMIKNRKAASASLVESQARRIGGRFGVFLKCIFHNTPISESPHETALRGKVRGSSAGVAAARSQVVADR